MQYFDADRVVFMFDSQELADIEVDFSLLPPEEPQVMFHTIPIYLVEELEEEIW